MAHALRKIVPNVKASYVMWSYQVQQRFWGISDLQPMEDVWQYYNALKLKKLEQPITNSHVDVIWNNNLLNRCYSYSNMQHVNELYVERIKKELWILIKLKLFQNKQFFFQMWFVRHKCNYNVKTTSTQNNKMTQNKGSPTKNIF